MPDMTDLQINELTTEGTAWLVDLLERIETLDVDRYVARMTEDVELVLQNGLVTLQGADVVREAFLQPWAGLRSLVHTELSVLGSDLHFVHESDVAFQGADGSTWSAKSTAWIDRDASGRLRRARIYGAV